jgi:hypothetical protein
VLNLWVQLSSVERCTRFNIKGYILPVICYMYRSVDFTGYSYFPHQWNGSPQYNRNIIVSGDNALDITNIVYNFLRYLSLLTSVKMSCAWYITSWQVYEKYLVHICIIVRSFLAVTCGHFIHYYMSMYSFINWFSNTAVEFNRYSNCSLNNGWHVC